MTRAQKQQYIFYFMDPINLSNFYENYLNQNSKHYKIHDQINLNYKNGTFIHHTKSMIPSKDFKAIVTNQTQLTQVTQKPTQTQVPRLLVIMFIYLYFVQGILISFGTTMPYIYNELPNYQVMSIFATVAIPFSLKFLTAPITQKINFVLYGKRKTWIIFSQVSASFLLYFASFYTDFSKAQYFALILISLMFFISLQDISLDCLALKQIKIPHLVSMVSTVPNAFGLFFGSLLLLKFTSTQFALKIGLQESISNPATILKFFSVLSMITATLVHIYFKETVLQMEKQIHKKSFWEVLCYYRVFVNSKTKYFRLVAFFLTYYQGFNFFNAGYDYELIKAGFSRDVNNTINNIIIIPITLFACLFSSKIQKFGLVKSTVCSQAIIILMRIYLLSYFPLNVEIIFIVNFLINFAYTWQYMITAIMINLLPIYGVSGMLLTVLASSINFGEQKGVHTLLISIFGWKKCAFIGIMIQLGIILVVPKFYEWIDKGSIQIQAQKNEQTQQETKSFQEFENYIYNEVSTYIDDQSTSLEAFSLKN